jgi:hypothetical protein
MLGEEVFTVEFVAFAFDCALRTRRAAVVREAEMLGGDVAFPFVLGAEGAGAAGEGEGAREWASMSCSNMLSEGRRIFEWCVTT